MLFRYKLPMSRKIDSAVVDGTLLYSYKWVYSKKDLDLKGAIKESASNMREFESKDKSDSIERIRAVHIKSVRRKKKEIIPEQLPNVDLKKMKKSQLIDFLISKGFTESEYKGKTKPILMELAEMSLEIGDL